MGRIAMGNLYKKSRFFVLGWSMFTSAAVERGLGTEQKVGLFAREPKIHGRFPIIGDEVGCWCLSGLG